MKVFWFALSVVPEILLLSFDSLRQLKRLIYPILEYHSYCRIFLTKVGSFARGLFLVHSECLESNYISSRPFRVNAVSFGLKYSELCRERASKEKRDFTI